MDLGFEFGLSLPSGSSSAPGAPSAPSVIGLSATSVSEGVSPGAVVASIFSNGTAPVTLSKVSDPDNKFNVVGSSLTLAAGLDHGTATSHTVRIRAQNSEGFHEQTFVINVIDVVVAPTVLSLSTTELTEDALPGSIVATISSDGDAPVTIVEVTDPESKFLVNGGNLELAAAVSAPASHDIRIRASNGGGGVEQTFTINVVEASTNDDKITSLVIDPEGWKATMTVTNAVDGGTYSGLNNPSSPGLLLTVTSKSWDIAGVETTTQRSVFATSVIRQPYPNGTLLQETEVTSNLEVVLSLSERIYAGDTVTAVAAASLYTDNGTGGSSSANSGGAIATVTNGSTEAYRKPQAVWLELEDQEVKSAAWAPKLCVYHRHAQQGRPVRAIKFIASDGTNTVENTVSALTTSQYSASGLYANYFQPNWNLSSLTDGEFITVDAVIYPWVGDAFQLTVDGAAYPSPNISTLRAICNIGGTMYNKVYAYVDGTGAGSPAANTDEATAKANPFASFAAAATAAKAVNLAENGWNNLSGVDLVLSSGTTYSDRLSGMGGALDKLPCTMRGEDATAVLTDGTSSASGSTIPPNLHVRDINIRKERNFIMFRGDNTGNGYLAFENCACSFANGEGSYEALTYQYGRGAVINCTGPYIGLCGQFGTTQGGMLFAGNAFGGNQPYNMVACNAAQIATNNHQLGQADGSVFAWNTVSRSGNNGNAIQFQGDAFGDQGVAVIGNVVEIHTLVGSQTAFLVFGDGDTTTVENLCESMNTIVGQRTNFLYNDIGTVSIPKDGVSKLSYHWQFNQKGDYDIDQPIVGNWASRHGVDTKVTAIRDSAGNDNYSYQSWLGEQLGDDKSANAEGPFRHVFNPFQTVNPDWVNDQSSNTGGPGGGDYTPGASNTLPKIPAGQTEFAVDQKGRAIPLDGTAVVGALQQVV